MIKKIFNWIWYSSADPERVSLTVKSFLLGLVPVLLYFAGLGHVSVSQDELVQVFNSIAIVVQSALGIVAALGFVIGLVRKIFVNQQLL